VNARAVVRMSVEPGRPALNRTGHAVNERFSVKEAHAIVRHLLRRNPVRYFTDLAATMAVVYLTGFVYLRPGLSVLQFAAGVACGCALFRAGMFIHEIQHMRRGEMTGFVVVWNLVCGIPMMLPSFMYANHRDHHDPRTYGTERDGEYCVFVTGGIGQIAAHFLIGLVAPPVLVLRFLVLGPLSLGWPRLRRIVLVHGMTLGDPAKGRRIWPDEDLRCWGAGCCRGPYWQRCMPLVLLPWSSTRCAISPLTASRNPARR
jgi:hypothetical protein